MAIELTTIRSSRARTPLLEVGIVPAVSEKVHRVTIECIVDWSDKRWKLLKDVELERELTPEQKTACEAQLKVEGLELLNLIQEQNASISEQQHFYIQTPTTAEDPTVKVYYSITPEKAPDLSIQITTELFQKFAEANKHFLTQIAKQKTTLSPIVPIQKKGPRCGTTSLAQMLATNPRESTRIRASEHESMKEFFAEYERHKKNPSAPLSPDWFDGIIQELNLNEQQDIVELLESLYAKMPDLQVTCIDENEQDSKRAPLLSLSLQGFRKGATLTQVLRDQLFTPRRFLENSPEILYLAFDRNEGGVKNTTPIQIDEQFTLPEEYVVNGTPSNYELVSFAVHQGTTKGGHYISYLKTVDEESGEAHYWLWNDLKTPPSQKITYAEFTEAAKQASLLTYNKIGS